MVVPLVLDWQEDRQVLDAGCHPDGLLSLKVPAMVSLVPGLEPNS